MGLKDGEDSNRQKWGCLVSQDREVVGAKPSLCSCTELAWLEPGCRLGTVPKKAWKTEALWCNAHCLPARTAWTELKK